MRLDKFLADCEQGTRSEVKKIIKKGLVTVNDAVITESNYQITSNDNIAVNGIVTNKEDFVYYIFHKPAGCVCAAKDNLHPTIFQYVPMNQKKNLFTVGRLDIDTEGLLLITNDGELAHRLLSPKQHVEKTYYAVIDKEINEDDVAAFMQGVDIHEAKLTKPAKLEILKSDEKQSEVLVSIVEGKFHQIKRMFQARGGQVMYLKRLTMGKFTLDEKLTLGKYRILNEKEMTYVKEYKSGNL